MSERDKDYYTLLGITPAATSEQVETAYQAALKATEAHGLELDRKAVEHAFAILGDPAARATYDATRVSGEDVAARYSEDDTGDASLPRTEVNHPRDPKGYYKLLRVPVDASREEIVAAYHHIAQGGLHAGVTARPLDAFLVAYNVLSDPIVRVAYDPSWRKPRWSQYADMVSEGRRFTEDDLRLHDPAPERLHRVTNSPFGCLSVLLCVFGLVLCFI